MNTLEVIAGMRVYLVKPDTNKDPAFMRDFFRQKLEDAITYAEGALPSDAPDKEPDATMQ